MPLAAFTAFLFISGFSAFFLLFDRQTEQIKEMLEYTRSPHAKENSILCWPFKIYRVFPSENFLYVS